MEDSEAAQGGLGSKPLKMSHMEVWEMVNDVHHYNFDDVPTRFEELHNEAAVQLNALWG